MSLHLLERPTAPQRRRTDPLPVLLEAAAMCPPAGCPVCQHPECREDPYEVLRRFVTESEAH